MVAQKVGNGLDQIKFIIKCVVSHLVPQEQVGVAVGEAGLRHFNGVLEWNHLVVQTVDDDGGALHLLGFRHVWKTFVHKHVCDPAGDQSCHVVDGLDGADQNQALR